jgi:hypothetical protein
MVCLQNRLTPRRSILRYVGNTTRGSGIGTFACGPHRAPPASRSLHPLLSRGVGVSPCYVSWACGSSAQDSRAPALAFRLRQTTARRGSLGSFLAVIRVRAAPSHHAARRPGLVVDCPMRSGRHHRAVAVHAPFRAGRYQGCGADPAHNGLPLKDGYYGAVFEGEICLRRRAAKLRAALAGAKDRGK